MTTPEDKTIRAEPMTVIPRSPYPLELNKNQVLFTPSQVEAIKVIFPFFNS